MSLLTICTALANNVGIAAPDVVASSPLRQWAEAMQFANEAGEELARRVDWGQLQSLATLTGDGTNKVHDLPAMFARLNNGISVLVGTAIVRPLTRAEWSRLVPTEGIPRYYLLEGQKIKFWPYLANGVTASAGYQSLAWCSNGTGAFAADTDTALIDEWLLTKGLIVRWRRQKGAPYADQEAEYEATLADLARFNDRARF